MGLPTWLGIKHYYGLIVHIFLSLINIKFVSRVVRSETYKRQFKKKCWCFLCQYLRHFEQGYLVLRIIS